MVKSSLTDQTKTSKQSSPRDGITVDTFLIHHQASTNDNGTIAAMVSGAKEVSANYTISTEGRLTSIVPEERRAWTSGSSTDGGKGAHWDKRSITVEIENQTGDPDWKISDKAIQTAAELLHDLKTRYKITHVLGHRDLWSKYQASYPTFCPGLNTVSRILDAENDIKDEVKKPVHKPAVKPTPKPVTKPTPKPAVKPKKDYVLALPSASLQVRIQRALARHGFYSGPADGKFGDKSLRGIQQALTAFASYKGPIDGDIEEDGARLIQTFAKKKGGYSGKVDKKLGPLSWAGFATALERTP